MKKPLLIVIILYWFIDCAAQLSPPTFINFPPATGCGIINPTVSLVSVSPACYESPNIIELKTDIQVDSIYVNFGDGKDTIIVNPPSTVFNITHFYEFSPSDSCPPPFIQGQPALVCNIQGHFFIRCAGTYSYTPSSTAISFRFKPRVRFDTNNFNRNYIPGVILVGCNTDCFQIDLSNSCTNTYWNTDSTNYTWSFGDGRPDIQVNNEVLNEYQSPQFCYPVALPNGEFYTLKLRAENTCGVSLDSAKVYVQGITDFQISSGPYCTGSPIELQITTTGGDSTYQTRLIVAADSIVGSNTNSPKLWFNNPGTYPITVEYGRCARQETIVVQEGVMMSQSPIPDDCFSGSNQLVLSNYLFSWSGTQTNNYYIIHDSAGIVHQNTTTGAISSSPISLPFSGRYIVIDTSITTCNTVIFRDTFIINPRVTIALPSDTSVCLQGYFNVPAVAGATISGDTTATGLFLIQNNQIYRFTYTPSCGSAATLQVTGIGVKAFANDAAYCSSVGTIILTGSEPGMTFSGNHVSGNEFNGSVAGLGNHEFYTQFVDSSTTCFYRDTGVITIDVPQNVSITFPDTACVLTEITGIFTGGANYEVKWEPSVINNSNTHTYTTTGIKAIEVKFIHGQCDTTLYDTIVVIPAPDPQFSFSTPDTVCAGDSVVVITTQSPLYNYSWTVNPQGISSDIPPQFISVNPSMTVAPNHVEVSVTSSYCATATASGFIMVNPETRALIALDYDSLCSPLILRIINNSIVSPSGATFQWYKNGTLFSNTANLIQYDTIRADIDPVTVEYLLIAFSCGIYDTTKQSITIYPADFIPAIYVDSRQGCVNAPFTFSSSVVPGCLTSYNFGDGYFSQQTTSEESVQHIYQSAGEYTVELAMFCECKTNYDRITVKVNPAPEIAVVAPPQSCSKNLVQFEIQNIGIAPAFNYQMSFGDSTFSIGSFRPAKIYDAPGNYSGWATAIGANGCISDTVAFNITIHALPNVDFVTLDTFACTEILTLFQVNTPLTNTTYEWLIINNDTQNVVTTFNGELPLYSSSSGEYKIVLTAYNNNLMSCIATSDTLRINVIQSPKALFNTNPIYVVGEENGFEIINTSQPEGIGYFWNFGDDSYSNVKSPDTKYYIEKGVYIISLAVANGPCTDTTQQEVTIFPKLNIFLPNVFSPNRDGNNDFFEMFGNIEDVTFFHIRIFDRWGEKIFESNDKYFRWDGTYKGKELNPGVYVYTLHVVGLGNPDIVEINRSITIIR